MTAVRLDHVTKAYDLQAGSRTLFSAIKAVTGSNLSRELFHALSDVSFEIHKGDAFGIIGRNGSGKSTILKIIAGITRPTSGSVEVNGLVSSLIELGAGFHPDLTGRENVYMSAAILGISRKFIDLKFKEIVDFAELWDFIDVPVKKYSSGMYARLGFAVAVSVNPEILIIDEILSVGDIFFQQRCFAKMREIIGKGTTFIFVTHDTAAMQNLCDRALLLESGRVEYIGSPIEAVTRYHAKASSKLERSKIIAVDLTQQHAENKQIKELAANVRAHSFLTEDCKRHGARGLEIVAARVTDIYGKDAFHVGMQGQLVFHLLLHANQNIAEPTSGLNLYDRMGNLIFAAGTPQLKHTLPGLKTGQEIVIKFELTFNVGPGEYTFSLIASEPVNDSVPNVGYFHDQFDLLGPITVVADETKVYPFYGIAQLPMKITNSEPTESK
jgi:lipopolysaccharide transport system ATP-binding protein